jgi:hypothetical protein
MAASTVIAILPSSTRRWLLGKNHGAHSEHNENPGNELPREGPNWAIWQEDAAQGDGVQKAHGRYGRKGSIKPEQNRLIQNWSRLAGNRTSFLEASPLKILRRLHLQPNQSRGPKRHRSSRNQGFSLYRWVRNAGHVIRRKQLIELNGQLLLVECCCLSHTIPDARLIRHHPSEF